MTAIANRYEFVYLFDVINGNPNGDPDTGNMPRIDPETNHGLVTDVCLKRKVRNYVDLLSQANGLKGTNIYVREKAVLNRANELAYKAVGITPVAKKLPGEAGKAQELTDWMCANFYDIRTFGALMATEVNCGQVRGPVQIAFAKSIDPIIPQEISITRMAVTNEKDVEKERTIGRKQIVPYGLYRVHGFISAPLAGKSGFSEDDLELFWSALENMFEHDRSAARGEMSARRLIVFKHQSALGNAHASKLFETVHVSRESNGAISPARAYGEYTVSIDRDSVPAGVEVIERM
jgi:CRISPR-associated protein Csd2